jgi:hypothetical protein
MLGAGPASGGEPWSVRTAVNEYGSRRQNYNYTINPGEQVTDGLVVVNHGGLPLNLAVYAADGFTSAAGRFDLAAKNGKPHAVGAWVRPGRHLVAVQPGETVEVPFILGVPEDGAPGDYMGGIVTSLTRDAEAGGTDEERRAAIRIRLHVAGAFKPGLSVESLRVHYTGTPNPFGKGDAIVSYTILNTGNAILAVRQSVALSGPFGRWAIAAGTVADSPPLLPGETWKVSVPLHGVVPALRLTASVALTPLLTDAAGSITPLAAITASGHARAIPWGLVLAVTVLCGLVFAVPASRTRLRVGVPHRSQPQAGKVQA